MSKNDLKSLFAAYRKAQSPKTWLGPFGGRVLFGTDLLERVELRWSSEGVLELCHGPMDAENIRDTDPIGFLEKRSRELGLPGIGFISYEAGRLFENLPGTPFKSSPWPLFRFDFYREIHEIPLPQRWSSSTSPISYSDSQGPLPATWPPGHYAKKVEEIRQLIRWGDVYQVNLVQPFKTPFPREKAADLFEALRELDPSMSGFRALMEDPGSTAHTSSLGSSGQTLLSDSPELFLQRRGNILKTRPIKGTLRISSQDQGEAAAQELLSSTKDRAELAMIVDLMRNDLSRVCRPGSVRVQSFPEVLTLPHLVHSQATVEGELREGTSLRDCLAATFPCGSISGCPRLRAMQRIEELEGEARGPAFGAIGILEPTGDFLLSVAIRTASLAEDFLELKAGGGITIESNPTEEAAESELKTRLFSQALGSFFH